MKFIRNDETGELDVYDDDGNYLGTIYTNGIDPDGIPEDKK